MQVTKEQVDPCTVALDIQIEPETVSKAFGQAYREFGQFTNVPGFRPGKAPRKMVERYVNQERLRERVRELVAAPAYREALKQEQITPYADPDVEFSDLADGQSWQFKAVVPMPPHVELADLASVSVERPVYTVTDKDVNQRLEALRSEHAKLERVDGRGVEADDVVIAEMSIDLEGAEAPEEMRRTLVRMGDNIPGFDEAVLGQQPDEERKFTLTFPDDYQDADRAGKKGDFTVRVQSINRRVLPEVTDEWVSGVTSFQTVQELHDAVRQDLETQYRSLSDNVVENAILDELVKSSKIEFPSVMAQQEMQDELNELSEELQGRNMSYEEYLAATEQTQDVFEQRIRAAAIHRVQTVLVMRELARQFGLEVSNDELAEELARLVVVNRVPEDDARRMIRDERQRARVANVVIRRKLREKLFETVKVTEKAAEAP